MKKKICLLGSFAVGKTSLTRQYVESIFSEEYKTTLGVSIDKKNIQFEGKEITLVIWDVHGEDGFQKIMPAYFRGLAGFLLVVDLTRPETVDAAYEVYERVISTEGEKPFVLVKNKNDLRDLWLPASSALADLEKQAASVEETSAKDGASVERTFAALTTAIMTSPMEKVA